MGGKVANHEIFPRQSFVQYDLCQYFNEQCILNFNLNHLFARSCREICQVICFHFGSSLFA